MKINENLKNKLRKTYSFLIWFFYFFIKSPRFETYVRNQNKLNRKYFSIVKKNLQENSDSHLKPYYAKKIPQKIWIYWEQGIDSAPLVVQKCIESWKSHNPTYNIVLLNKETISNYIVIPNIPESLPARYRADLYRLMLLNKHGGIWADATTYCHRPLNEWLPLFFSSGFFMFSNPSDDRDIESWFIASIPDHPLISNWEFNFKKYLLSYKKMPSAYFIMFYIFQWMLIKDKQLNQLYRQSSSLNATACFFMKSVLTENTQFCEFSSLIMSGLPLSKLDWRLDISNQELISFLAEIEKIKI